MESPAGGRVLDRLAHPGRWRLGQPDRVCAGFERRNAHAQAAAQVTPALRLFSYYIDEAKFAISGVARQAVSGGEAVERFRTLH